MPDRVNDVLRSRPISCQIDDSGGLTLLSLA